VFGNWRTVVVLFVFEIVLIGILLNVMCDNGLKTEIHEPYGR